MHALLSEAVHTWFFAVSTDLSYYAVFAVGVWLVLWVLLGPVLRARRIRAERPPARQLVTEFLVSGRSVVIFATLGVAIYLLSRAGFYPLAELARRWGPAWFFLSIVATVVAHDAYLYWTHRLMHDPRLFRRFHRRHHRSSNPSPFTAYSFDLREAAVMVGFSFVWPLVFPTPWETGYLITLHQIIRNTLLHSGYELMPMRKDGKPWLDFLTTTTHHDLHHAQAGYNYAAWFTWWDRWMGTEHPEYHARYAEAARRPYLSRPRAQAVA